MLIFTLAAVMVACVAWTGVWEGDCIGIVSAGCPSRPQVENVAAVLGDSVKLFLLKNTATFKS